MPNTYSCSSCGLTIHLGSYHGFGSDGWFSALYCRQCGTHYALRQTTAQFFDGIRGEFPPGDGKILRFEILGPTTTQSAILSEGSSAPSVTCEVCKEVGPFGPRGPLTDELPEGLISEWDFPVVGSVWEARGKCPKCKEQAMKFVGEWTT
jgi:hypothetical protein